MKKEEKYAIFDNMIEGIQVIDSEWRYVYVNETVAAQGKSKRDELFGKTMPEKYPGIENTGMFENLRKCMNERIAHNMINEFDFPNGSKGYFQLRMQPVAEGVLIMSFDITEQKKMELEREKTIIERTHLLDQIIEQKKQLDEYCYIIAHNMRAPLSNLLLLYDLVLSSKSMQEKLSYFEKQKPIIDTLQDTFEMLVETTHVRTSPSMEIEQIELEICIRNALDQLRGEIIKFKADVTYDFSKAGTVHFPKKYIDSIVLNLLSNSIRYRSPERVPEIHIQSYNENGWIFLEIKDNGLGIDLNKHGDKLFKLRKVFHSHPEAKGFGLFLTKTQVEAMGGKISAQSTPGEGSVFTVKLSKNQNA